MKAGPRSRARLRRSGAVHCDLPGRGDHGLVAEAQEDPLSFHRVTKMKFGGRGRDKDRSTVIYNDRITMENIPLRGPRVCRQRQVRARVGDGTAGGEAGQGERDRE